MSQSDFEGIPTTPTSIRKAPESIPNRLQVKDTGTHVKYVGTSSYVKYVGTGVYAEVTIVSQFRVSAADVVKSKGPRALLTCRPPIVYQKIHLACGSCSAPICL